MTIIGGLFLGTLVGFITACIFLFHYKEQCDMMKIACDNYRVSLGIADREKKKMVELLGRVYIDIDQTNGSLYHDTIKELRKWVNG